MSKNILNTNEKIKIEKEILKSKDYSKIVKLSFLIQKSLKINTNVLFKIYKAYMLLYLKKELLVTKTLLKKDFLLKKELLVTKTLLEKELLINKTLNQSFPPEIQDIVEHNLNGIEYVHFKYGHMIKELGKGAYGIVGLYKNINNDLWAIKIVEYADSVNIIQSALKETAIFQRMDHPNVLSLQDYTISPNFKEMYLISPFMVNGELTYYMRGGIYNPNKVAKKLTYQLLSGVAYMHSLNIIHRDLKPQNILLDKNFNIKIADFGISKALTCVDPSGKTVEVVTLWYRPPELLYGGKGRDYGTALDVWSVGCIVYEIVTRGLVLFQENNENGMRLTISYLLGNPNEKVWPGVSLLPEYNPIEIIKPIRYKAVKSSISSSTNINYLPNISNKKEANEWFNIIMSMIQYDPHKRPTALKVLKQSFFNTVRNKKFEPKYKSCLDNLYLVETPINFTIDSHIILNRKMRSMTMDWLLAVTLKFKLRPRTYFIAIYLLNYIKTKDLFKVIDDYQLFGSACLYIAGLYNEVYSPESTDYVYYSDNSFTKIQLIDMSTKILNQIKFKMVFSTCYDFLVEYKVFYSIKVQKLSTELLYFFSLLPDKLYLTKPDQVALMSIMVASIYYEEKFKHNESITNELIKQIKFCEHFTDKNMNNIEETMNKLIYSRLKIKIQDVMKKVCNSKLIQ